MEFLAFQSTTRNRTSEMKSYHIMTSWGSELCTQGFGTLSEAVEMAGEICADTFMLDGEEMELYVECHDDFSKCRVAMVLHTGKAVMLDDVEE